MRRRGERRARWKSKNKGPCERQPDLDDGHPDACSCCSCSRATSPAGRSVVPPPGIHLPASTADVPPQTSVVVAIDKNEIVVGSDPVISVVDAMSGDELEIAALSAHLQAMQQAAGRDRAAARRRGADRARAATIQGDTRHRVPRAAARHVHAGPERLREHRARGGPEVVAHERGRTHGHRHLRLPPAASSPRRRPVPSLPRRLRDHRPGRAPAVILVDADAPAGRDVDRAAAAALRQAHRREAAARAGRRRTRPEGTGAGARRAWSDRQLPGPAGPIAPDAAGPRRTSARRRFPVGRAEKAPLPGSGPRHRRRRRRDARARAVVATRLASSTSSITKSLEGLSSSLHGASTSMPVVVGRGGRRTRGVRAGARRARARFRADRSVGHRRRRRSRRVRGVGLVGE